MRTRQIATVLILIVVALGALATLFLKWRGFRASSAPSAFEIRTARFFRNFAIPQKERELANPFANDDIAAAQGRELFLGRCSTCHGIDGRGSTPIGANQYPRVPNLHSDLTQRMSDGEIHYIIQNGVQLTGMPAMPGAHSATDADSWKLVSYIRSFRSPTRQESETQSSVERSAHYVGSASCEKCHAAIYERWRKTPMANVVRDPRQHPDAIIPDLSTNHIARFTIDDVALVYGSKWKQRYFTKVGNDYYPLPVQWDIGTKEWLKYHVPDKGADWWAAFYPSDNMQRPTGPTCDGCHSVNYDIHNNQVTEWNVGCERCHGPGSEHIAHPTRNNILNPGEMDDFASDDICIQCHSQGQPRMGLIEGKAFDWPVGYRAGLRLADYWKIDSPTLGQADFLYFADGTAHKNRMQGNDFVQSVMYRHGVTCVTCHDVHGTDNYAQLRKPADKICLDCHGPNSPNGPHAATLEEHTHHKDGSPGSQCVACHMPKIETEGVPGSFVTAHTFRFITPVETDKYRIPNPCNSCHADKSLEWATNELLRWKTISPWRAAE